MPPEPKKSWWILVNPDSGVRVGSSIHPQTLADFVSDLVNIYGIDWGIHLDVREATEAEIAMIPPWVSSVGQMKAEAMGKPISKSDLGVEHGWIPMRELFGWSLMLMLFTGRGKPQFHLLARKANGEVATLNELNFVGSVLACLGVTGIMPVGGAPSPDGTWRFTWPVNGDLR